METSSTSSHDYESISSSHKNADIEMDVDLGDQVFALATQIEVELDAFTNESKGDIILLLLRQQRQ